MTALSAVTPTAPSTLAPGLHIDEGSYQQVLERWGLEAEAEAEAVDRAETNPPGLPKTEERAA
ncbi:hypothetical protein [Promicromonospora kroppenstedtii]|uniref:hypothetical protein n=1 Tax=Promicromonospora kroppenstedtii TaxID=440482 RepID=UPI0004B5FA65|nr:hypothetical protein [Promicromonospora kroppenstedtii]